MVATYPNDAVFNANNFSVIGSVAYTNTGSSLDFNITGTVEHRGEVLVIADGITQSTTAYTLSNSGSTVSFFDAPNVSNLTIKTLTIPSTYRKLISTPTMYSINYSNSAPVVVNSNTYIIDGSRTVWSVPANATPSSKSELLIIVSGAILTDNAYQFPSTTLSTQGIDISPAIPGLADNTLQVRVIDTDIITYDRCRTMADKKPDKGTSSTKKFDVVKLETSAGYEKRRLRSRKPIRSYDLSYTNASGLLKESIEAFFNARSGEFETFIFDLDHIGQIGTIYTRFDGDLNITHVMTKGSGVLDNWYNITFKLKEVFD